MSGTISKDCKTCFDWQKTHDVDYGWLPCLSKDGKPACAPYDTAGGYRDPSGCLSHGPAPLDKCSDLNPFSGDKSDCENCIVMKENYKSMYQRTGPDTYSNLANTWTVQKPYNL